MSKLLKNTTGSIVNILDTGVSIPASPGSYLIPPQDYLLWAASNNVITKVGDGSLVVNDGSADLSISDGIDLIKGIFPSKIKITNGTYDADVLDVDGVKRLAVAAAITGTISSTTPTISSKLLYLDMNASNGGVARQTVIDSNWTQIFSSTGSGLLHEILINLETNSDWRIRLVVDNNELFTSNGILSDDVRDDQVYDFDTSGKSVSFLDASTIFWGDHDRFIWNSPNFPIKWTSSVKVYIRRSTGAATKKFRAGLVVLNKDS